MGGWYEAQLQLPDGNQLRTVSHQSHRVWFHWNKWMNPSVTPYKERSLIHPTLYTHTVHLLLHTNPFLLSFNLFTLLSTLKPSPSIYF